MCRECGCAVPHQHHHRHHRHQHLHRHRHFLTKEERAEKLESYAEELRKELGAVEQRIKDLRT